MKEITLKEVCSMLGVSRRAVQGYEQAGLVHASGKNRYGYLLYDEAAVEKIRSIKQYQDFGFSVKKIKILLDASEREYVDMLNERLMAMKCEFDALKRNIDSIERLIAARM